MISEAFALAILTFTGFALLYQKFPEKMKKFMRDHTLLTDIIITVGTYGFLGGTLTALFASAFVDLFVLIAFYIANHKEQFSYLWDLRDAISSMLDSVQSTLTDMGKEYKGDKDAGQEQVPPKV
jgi:hypothetical protein